MYSELNGLLIRAKEGDRNSKEEIVNRLQGLIIKSIQRYYNKMDEYEDLIQEGNLVILEAIDDYDSSRGVYFLGYVKSLLKYAYLNKYKIRHHISLNTKLADKDCELIDLLESDDVVPLEKIIKFEEHTIIYDALSILTDRQRQIVVLFYMEELSIGDIAKRLNISYRTVINTKVRALEKMRKYIDK